MDEQFRGAVSGAYRAFHAELLKFLGKRLGSQADAADLAQDAFAQWLGSRDRARVAQPRAFLFQIARNLLRDHWRRQQVRGGTEPAPVEHDEALFEHAAPGPQDKAEQHQRLHHLARALDDLPPRRREAFVLHKFDGLSQAEVAERMGISLSMVEKHVACALLHCRQRLLDAGQEDVP